MSITRWRSASKKIFNPMRPIIYVVLLAYLAQAVHWFSIKYYENKTRDYLLEIAKAYTKNDENKISVGHPGGVPIFACNFLMLEFYWRDCSGLTVGIYEGTDKDKYLPSLVDIASNPCKYIGYIAENDREDFVEYFGCPKLNRQYKFVIYVRRVTYDTPYPGAKKINTDFIEKLTINSRGY